ncbi:MAG: alpha-glucuronidase [Actinobacteria bacterium]|nr:alpha-glucuronidase [Actinomycetota bacterium]
MSMYDCWLGYPANPTFSVESRDMLSRVAVTGASVLLRTARDELVRGLAALTASEPRLVSDQTPEPHVLVAGPRSTAAAEVRAALGRPADGEDEVILLAGQPERRRIVITSNSEAGCLHAAFAFLRRLQLGQDQTQDISGLRVADGTGCQLRLVSHWDNLDGTIERGYAGASIFFTGGQVTADRGRVRDYARLLASVGVNAVCLNNVNVTREATRLLTPAHLPQLAVLAGVFRDYGIRVFLSVSFDSPIVISGLRTADPLDPLVAAWWQQQAAQVYEWIPDLGGFMVKADSESRPGPAVYERTQAEGANVIARALAPFGGIVLWRAFVYNCWQDWRDRRTDRARACYDTFMPLDGAFDENVVVQTKIGPMDFQVREPSSPLLSALRSTSQALEVQITQEYTGQQKDLCFLLSQWHEVMSEEFDVDGSPTTLARILTGHGGGTSRSGVTGVANVGDDPSWTGHVLAQANLYAYGRLAWDLTIEPQTVAAEWVAQTFGRSEPLASAVTGMLLDSWRIYESYTAPLGVGWMVTPGTHYGPSVDGYEYSRWGTYHFADRDGIGVDRTVRTGTGFTAQYEPRRAGLFEDLATCPDELLLFFHHVPYLHRLRSGKTVIQHIYDEHFDGAEGAQRLLGTWQSLTGLVDPVRHEQVRRRLELQVANAAEWRDVINSYFFRKSGIPDERGRAIY